MIRYFHIHLYYDQSTLEIAKDLATDIKNKYSIPVGTFHERNVGPHPMWSVQLSVSNELFGEILAYVALNRNGLTVFSHPDTGNDLRDHTDHAIWMGRVQKLNLDMFNN